jgi:hypothetical protein
MSRKFHLALSVRGTLHNAPDRELRTMFVKPDGSYASVREAKDFLMDQLAAGRKVIPTCECDNFDYQNGCMGHEEPENALADGEAGGVE